MGRWSGSVLAYSDLASGGNGRYVSLLAQALAREADGVEWVCPWPDDAFDPDDVAVQPTFLGAQPGTVARRVPALLLRTARFARFWWGSPREQRVVVGICNHLEAVVIGLVLLTRRPRGGSMFVVHDPVPHRWFLPRAMRGFEISLAEQSWRLFDQLVVHSRVGRSRILASGRDPVGVRLIAHPIADGGAPPHPGEVRAGLCVLGTMRPDKDYPAVVRAYQALPLEEKQRHLLVIAGRPQAGFDLSSLERVVALDPVGIDLRPGYVTRAEIERTLAKAAACVLPYVDPESASGVAADAIAAGCPALVPDAGALAELVEDGLARVWPDRPAERTQALLDALTGPPPPEAPGTTGATYADLAALCVTTDAGDER